MRKSIVLQLILFVGVSYLSTAQQNNVATQSADWKLVWSDEFSKDGVPDSLSWIFENGFVRNKELQWYQPQNAYCKDGLLVFEGKREKFINPNYLTGSDNWKKSREYVEYTSASINTSGLHAWQYGRFEVCARIDTSMGLWPAIWTLGVEKEWPHNGEIDMMEFYRIDNVPHILANVAWGTTKRWVGNWNSVKTPLEKIMGNDKNWPAKFHIWRMDWDETSINLYLDDVLLNTTSLEKTINPDGSNPFKQPHYILLNLAIGEHGGDPSNTQFPVKYEVDYVRVYQR